MRQIVILDIGLKFSLEQLFEVLFFKYVSIQRIEIVECVYAITLAVLQMHVRKSLNSQQKHRRKWIRVDKMRKCGKIRTRQT